MSCVIWPGILTLIVPPYEQISVEESLSEGMFARRTVGAPTIQGDAVAGMQGIGVRTPMAEAVAAATVGLAGL